MCCTFLIWTEFNGLPEDMTVDVSHLINKDKNIHKKKPSEIKQSTIKLYKISGVKNQHVLTFLLMIVMLLGFHKSTALTHKS